MAWVLLGLVSLFVLYPLGMVLLESFRDEAGHFTLNHFARILSSPEYRKPISNTLLLASSVGFIGTAIGYLFAYATTRTDIGWKGFWRFTATFPMISPAFLVALSAIILFGNNGLLTKRMFGGIPGFSIYGFWGLLLVQTVGFFSTSFLICSALLQSIDPSLEEASLNAGAGRLKTFWQVTFPLSIPGLLNSFLLIFIESLADFANPLILSGNFKVLSVEAYLRIVGSELDLNGGSALALILLIPALIAFLIQQFWLSRKSFVTVTGKPSSASLKRLRPWERFPWWVALSANSLLIYVLYITVFFGSLVRVFGVDFSFTLDHYRNAFSTDGGTLIDSLLLALLATPLSGIFGIAVAYIATRTGLRVRHAIEWASLLTFAVPGTVVGIGYILAFNRPPLLLQGTAYAIVLLFVFRNAPLGIRAGVAALMQLDRSIEDASTNLGASRMKTICKIVMPLLAPVFVSGLAFAFIRCLNSISAVIFVVSGRWHLITVSLMNDVENGRLSLAAALCVILIAIVIVAISLMRKLFPSKSQRKFGTI